MEFTHYITGRNMFADYPEGLEHALFGMGCFWGAERLFWQTGGVYVTSVGYGGGKTKNPTYEQVCLGESQHVELVHVVFSPDIIPYIDLLKIFFENHDPTQGDRQGNDIGSQYRSAIFTYSDAQKRAALKAREQYNHAYAKAGKHSVTTQIGTVPSYYPAENYHQQYLAKNPTGYCNIGGTGVRC